MIPEREKYITKHKKINFKKQKKVERGKRKQQKKNIKQVSQRKVN